MPDLDAAAVPVVQVDARLRRATRELPWEHTPARGDLWRLEFDGRTALGYVADVAGDEVTVMPVGEDAAMADAATVIAGVDEAPFGFEVGIWVAAELRLPAFVLDRRLARLDTVDDEVAAIRGWLHGGSRPELPPGRVGPKIVDDLDPRVAYRAELRAELVTLADAAKAADTPMTFPEHPLGDLLRNLGLPPSDVAKQLGWDYDDVAVAFRDGFVASEAEAVYLAQTLGLPADEVIARRAPVPGLLLLALHQPRWRREVCRYGARRDLADAQARREVTRNALTGRLRTSGRPDDEPDWDQVLEDFFRGQS